MKKLLLVLFMSCLMVLGSAVSASATGVYADFMIGGKVEDDWYGDGDANDTYIGIDLPIDEFLINLELLTGDWDQRGNRNDDFSGYDLKGGYRILNDRDLRMYLTLSSYHRDFKDSGQEFSGILLGADAIANLSKKATLQGSIGFSLSGRFEQDGYHHDADLLNLKLKLNYLLAKDIYASLGYRYYGFKIDDLDQEVKAKGLTLGVNFKL